MTQLSTCLHGPAMSEPASSTAPRSLVIDLHAARLRKIELDGVIDKLVRERDALEAVIVLASDPRFAAPMEGATDAVELIANCSASETAPKIKAFTHRAMVLQVLQDADGPLGVRQMMDAITEKFGEQVERTSLSPLLRKLAHKGEVLHMEAQAKWALPETNDPDPETA